jgi:hypothetical protein
VNCIELLSLKAHNICMLSLLKYGLSETTLGFAVVDVKGEVYPRACHEGQRGSRDIALLFL